MRALFVASWTDGAGKTSLSAGLGKWLQKNGKKVSYFKPVSVGEPGTDGDKDFLALSLGLNGEAIAPVFASHRDVKSQVDANSLGQTIKKAAEAVANSDILLIEAPGGLNDADMAKASHQIAESVDAAVIVVAAYGGDATWDRIAAESAKFGKRLVGLVITRVPEKRLAEVREETEAFFKKKNIKVLAIMPEDRSLLGISVADIARHLGAKAVCCDEAMGELVENVMIGAMTPDSGADYFALKENKAVITRGSRPDMQLAALATSTKCLILTGDSEPAGQVLSWAEDKGVPVLITEKDTLSTVSEVEQAFVEAKFGQEAKVDKMAEMVEANFDFSSLAQGLGLAASS